MLLRARAKIKIQSLKKNYFHNDIVKDLNRSLFICVLVGDSTKLPEEERSRISEMQARRPFYTYNIGTFRRFVLM